MTQKIKVLITIIIVLLLFHNLRLMLCQIFSYDFTKIRNLPKSFKNVVPGFSESLHKCRTVMLHLSHELEDNSSVWF